MCIRDSSGRDGLKSASNQCDSLMKNLPYSRKYWRSIYLAVWPPRCYVVILAEFKSGGLSTTSHRRLCIANILAELKLAVWNRIAKPPNLNHRQIFRLYGKLVSGVSFCMDKLLSTQYMFLSIITVHLPRALDLMQLENQ